MILESVAAAVLLAGANYADYATTRSAIDRGGIEMNAGLYGPRAERLGPVKLGVVAGEVVVFELLKKQDRRLGWAWVASIVVVNLAIAHRNNQVLRERKP